MSSLPKGVDVASYQGSPDWQRVKADGYTFAITKATEGTDYTNPTFRRNWSELKRVRMQRGAYHFAQPALNRPEAEADYFYAAVLAAGGLETGDLLALDLEPTSFVPGLAAWALAWLRRVEQLAGFKPLVYTGKWVIDQQGMSGVSELAVYPLWLANYQTSMPAAPAPWSLISIWQHTSSGSVDGIDGDVDLDVFNGARERLSLLGKPADAAPLSPPGRPRYVLGFAALAARLGREVVGEPSEDEHDGERAGHPIRHQLTTRGEMVYWLKANRADFYPAA